MGIQLCSSRQPPQPNHEELLQPPLPRTSQSSPSPHLSSPPFWLPSKQLVSLTRSLARVPSPSLLPPTMLLPRSQRRLSTAFLLTRTPSQLCFSVMLSPVLLLRPERCPRAQPP